MLEPPQIAQTAAQKTAIIRLTIPRDEMRRVIGPGLRELLAAVAVQGIAPAGPWFTHQLRLDPDVFDFEIGVPVEAAVSAAGRVSPGQLPATNVVRAIYRGPYAGLHAAWAELDEWIGANGHTGAPNFWECYIAGPESSPDAATWLTELNRPLVR